VRVRNLAPITAWQDVKDHLRHVGHISHCEVETDPITRECLGQALVYFVSPDDARKGTLW
jgi:RNA recognition motif-containing protein